ncbi:MAG: hypothetical protein M3O36_21660, partial [Myxococcota bacterium]|nr:hypothetical protein [Myxococcota bacterium]
MPTLASTPQSSADFQTIRDVWRNSEEATPAALRALLAGFLARYPGDGLAPLARVYVAFVAMKQQDFPEADRQLAWGERLPPGTTRDTWTVAVARRARMKGQTEEALDLLRPLVGKSVDPIERALFEEELTLAALATHRDYEAISYMDAWLRASSEEEHEETAKSVASYVERLPKDVVLGALQAMRKKRASFGYGVDIERILASRLVAVATTTGDAELARLLLDSDGGPIALEADAGLALGELAMSRRGLDVVDGRTIGLLLPTDSP